MKTQLLPGYPGSYLRKTLGPFLIGAAFFAGACICLVLHGSTKHGIYLVAGGLFAAVFLAILFLKVVREYRALLPASKACPDCDQMIRRLDEGPGTPIHYDCKYCGIRWETGLSVPDP